MTRNGNYPTFHGIMTTNLVRNHFNSNALIAEALQTLTEKKRNVVLLSYFMDMSDADIAREMNLVRSTINEHRRRSLELMRKNMEESANEKK